MVALPRRTPEERRQALFEAMTRTRLARRHDTLGAECQISVGLGASSPPRLPPACRLLGDALVRMMDIIDCPRTRGLLSVGGVLDVVGIRASSLAVLERPRPCRVACRACWHPGCPGGVPNLGRAGRAGRPCARANIGVMQHDSGTCCLGVVTGMCC